MRDGNWKLVINGGKPKKKVLAYPNLDWDRPADGRDKLALFDLSKSRNETHNLAKKFPQRVAAMKQTLEAWEADVLKGATAQPEKN